MTIGYKMGVRSWKRGRTSEAAGQHPIFRSTNLVSLFTALNANPCRLPKLIGSSAFLCLFESLHHLFATNCNLQYLQKDLFMLPSTSAGHFL
jgi:hypothetical protein